MTEREETILVIYGMKYDGCGAEQIVNGLTGSETPTIDGETAWTADKVNEILSDPTSSEFVKTVDARLVE